MPGSHGSRRRPLPGPVALAVCLALLATAPAAAQVEVVVRGGRVDVSADAAPLAQILDRIAVSVGAVVEYQGAPPTQLLTLALSRRTPAEAMLSVLQGQGVDYALQMDAAGNGVLKLLVASGSTGSARPRPARSRPGQPAEPEPRPTPPPLPDVLERLEALGVRVAPGAADGEAEGADEPEAPRPAPQPLPTPIQPPGAGGERTFPGLNLPLPFALPTPPARPER